MEKQTKILVVDDDAEIRDFFTDYLAQNGYTVRAVPDGKAMWASLAALSYDLVVLDLMLPGEDGLHLCRELRKRSQIPVIMLTALSDQTDRVVGLEMGADDYVPKPFAPREVLARIRTVLRRTRGAPRRVDSADESREVHFRSWVLDTTERQLIAPDKVVVALSAAEYRLLLTFLLHPRQVLNRDQLSDLTRGRYNEAFDRSLDVMVSRLRKRLREDAREPTIIKTVRSEGYVLAADPVFKP